MDFQHFLNLERAKETTRKSVWQEQADRSRGVHLSGMGPEPFEPRTEAQIEEAARLAHGKHVEFLGTPSTRFLQALSEGRVALDEARSAYARGFSHRDNQSAAADRLGEATAAMQAALKALAEIAGVEV